jgi:hypothetical protein
MTLSSPDTSEEKNNTNVIPTTEKMMVDLTKSAFACGGFFCFGVNSAIEEGKGAESLF